VVLSSAFHKYAGPLNVGDLEQVSNPPDFNFKVFIFLVPLAPHAAAHTMASSRDRLVSMV
jgi:hypothetical protein